MKKIIRELIQRFGYDLYRYPEACERLIPHLKMLLSAHRIDMVIDVGANIGQFASEVRSLDGDIWIDSVEPDPNVYKKLAAKAAGDIKWRTYECALGRSSGKVTLNVFADSDFSSCLPANEFGAKRFPKSLKISGTVEVELKTLDELVSAIPHASIGSRVLLKLDTQGFDMEVLLGAATVLDQVRVVVTEVSLLPLYQNVALFPEVLDFMKDKGFALAGFFPVSRSEDYRIIESNCVFVREIGQKN